MDFSFDSIASLFQRDKKQKNNYSQNTRSFSLSDLKKSGDPIKISRDVFYELYIRNGDIRACVRDIARRVGVKGMYLEKNGEVYDAKPIEPIQEIFKYPTFQSFKVELFKHLMIGGEAYIVPVNNGFGNVVGFKFLDPRTMRKFYNKNTGEITKYEQWANGKSMVTFTTDELAYFQFEMNPNNNYEGLSIIEGIVYDALTDKEAIQRNFMFFENGMMPDGVIMLDPEFDADEIEIAKEKMEGQLKGTKNAHTMLISNTIKDIKTFSVSSKDLDWINQRKLTIDKVTAAIGTPKFLIGYTEGVQRSNGDASYTQYLDGTIAANQELAEFIMNELYSKFVDKYLETQGITIKLDGESSEDRTAIEEAQRKDIERGIISIDEARQERGKKPWANKGQTDVPLISSNIVILGEQKPSV